MIDLVKKKQLSVTLVEVNIFERMLPLVSGYLQAYALQFPEIESAVDFHKYGTTTRESAESIVERLLELESDVYALSCYLWNMKTMKYVARRILESRPDVYVLLGGPQVMKHAQDYLDPNRERFVICNGEGEITFSNFLKELLESQPDLGNVKGLSFYRDGELVTTEVQARLKSLDEIPSPYLTGVFDGGPYRMAVMETNRGCPFRCTYCYWGAATNDKVYKFAEERIRDEITWLSQNGVPLMYLADANWGMLKRDVELSNHIADCKEKNGVPVYVYFSAAKNSPDRVSTIARSFDDVGMLNIQPVSLQTLDRTALATVDRQNIKLDAYHALQNQLNEKGIGSFIELIWPLPGETLETFRQGIEKLCEMNAANLIAYPNLLLHNTPMYHQRQELGITSREVADAASEAELVVGTRDVPYEDFQQGLHFFYGVLALFNTHAFRKLGAYLHSNGKMPYANLFADFVTHCREVDPSNGFTKFCDDSIADDRYYEIVNYPSIYHITLHDQRTAFDALLHSFAKQQTWWDDELAIFWFEVDLLQKPYLYSTTEIANYGDRLSICKLEDVEERRLTVRVPREFASHINVQDSRDGDSVFVLDHARGQYPFNPKQNREENASYCSGKIQLISRIIPEWK